MKKLIFVAVALLILGGCGSCTKIEQSYSVEVTYQEGNTKVVLRAFEPTMVEINAEGIRETVVIHKLPQVRQYSGYLKITHREIKNVIWGN